MSGFVQVAYAVLLSYFLVLNVGAIWFIWLSLGENRRRRRQAYYTDFARLAGSDATPALSVIVPAYNEQAVIRDTVLSVLASHHPRFEVLVVNDGSTDGTLELLRQSFELEIRDVFYPQPVPTQRVRNVYRSRTHPDLWVVDKVNGGKADACNAGLNIASHPYVLNTDADCLFEPDTLVEVLRAVDFDPRRVVGIGGQLRPSNGLRVSDGRIVESRLPSSIVSRFQVIEYMSAFLMHRLAWSRLNAVPVVSGGFGVWRRETVIALDGFATDVTHEDIDLTLRAHQHFLRGRIPYEIVVVPGATIWTQVPGSWRDLRTQRKRWQRIVLEVLWKYRGMIFNPRYGVVGMLTMPYLLLYEGLGPVVEAFSYLLVAFLAITGLLSVKFLLAFLVFSVGTSAAVRLAGVLLDAVFFDTYGRADVARLSLLALLEPLIFRPALLWPRLYAFYEFVSGHKVHETLTRVPVSGDAAPTAGG
ncbi:MAG TPA: glycosyltransferase [Solirubrobacteraceae bacterium]|nr:glycosyltransferase [Solirubrobacteraceae bacterium]